MDINFLSSVNLPFSNKVNSNLNSKTSYNNLAPLKCDIVSFGSMKKNQFSGLDLVAVEKFKAPIDKFRTKEDFENWAENQILSIINKDYNGKNSETVMNRKNSVDAWKKYVRIENGRYTKAEQLLIFDFVTKNLKPDNTALPPTLNKGVLAQVISDAQNSLNGKTTDDVKKYAHALNLDKTYTEKLKSFVLDEGSYGDNVTKWVVIPSQKHDPKNFEKNITKLQLLSCNTWCTKTNMARPYLQDGDFHIYVENGKTKVAVRFIGNKVEEIQGKQNNTLIPIEYFPIVKEHLIKGKYKLSETAKEEFANADTQLEVFEDIKEMVKNKDAEGLFKYFGFKVTKDKNGMLEIPFYMQPFDDITMADLGVDENMLFENVVRIKGDADFSDSKLKSLGKIKIIDGDLILKSSKIEDIGELEKIGGSANFRFTNITNLKNLKYIGGDFDCSTEQYCNEDEHCIEYPAIRDFGNLQTVKGDANFENLECDKPIKIKTIGGDANFRNARLHFSDLTSIEGDANCETCVIKFDNLKTIGGDAIFDYAAVTLPKIEKIEGEADFTNTEVTEHSPYISCRVIDKIYTTADDPDSDAATDKRWREIEDADLTEAEIEKLTEREVSGIFDPNYIEDESEDEIFRKELEDDGYFNED